MCKHKRLLKRNRITTGKCFTEDLHGCMQFCIQPKGLQEYMCLDCGKEVYKKIENWCDGCRHYHLHGNYCGVNHLSIFTSKEEFCNCGKDFLNL